MVRGVKHFGCHDNPDKPVSVHEAQLHQKDIVAQRLAQEPDTFKL
jgi:hypothetical protein